MRIVTRSDFDSLISSVLLNITHDIDDVIIVQPRDITENLIEITANDIITNLPYHKNCGYWFDHHINEDEHARSEKFKGHFKGFTCSIQFRSIVHCIGYRK